MWIGQEALILKGTQIDSGSIAGARSIVTGRKIPHNTIWAGSPANKIKDGIFWDGHSVHAWKEEQTVNSLDYDSFLHMNMDAFSEDDGIYMQDKTEEIPVDMIDRKLNEMKSSRERCEYLVQLDGKKTKHRFAHSE